MGNDYEDLYTTGTVDTVYHNNLTLLFFHGILDIRTGSLSKLLIVSGQDTVLRFAQYELSIYNFRQQKLDSSLTCLFRDIDHDGADEMIVDVIWGGQACCHDVYFCSLSDLSKVRSKLHADGPDIEMSDLDGDSIPEIKFSEYKAGLSDYYWPPQIWKWDGDSLRLANYKFSDLILKDTIEFTPTFLKAMAQAHSSYDSTRWDNPYPPIEFKALIDIYAYGGRPDMIDSLFEYWSYNPGEEDYYRKVFYELGVNDMLNQLKKSNW
jgi:hypothetical protein